MAVAAARRAQKSSAQHTVAGNEVNTLNTPAKRMLPSSGVGSDTTPAKRLHTMERCTPGRHQAMMGRSSGVHSQHQHQQHDFTADDEDAMGFDMVTAGRALPFGPQSMGSSLPLRSIQQGFHQQPFNADILGSPLPRGIGRSHIKGEGLMLGRVGAQQQPGVQQGLGGPTGLSMGGLQLRTPSRPNSAGSALRGFVPPEHRCVRNIAIAFWCAALLLLRPTSFCLADA